MGGHLLLEDPLAGFSGDAEILFGDRQPILGRAKRPDLTGFRNLVRS